MQLFKCQACGQLLFFENRFCERCDHRLGYVAPVFEMHALEAADEGMWTTVAAPRTTYRFCENADYNVCNWLVPHDSRDRYCIACRHNQTVPHLGSERNMADWGKLEIAKHRLFYQLIRLGLPIPNKADDQAHGLVFDFLADPETEHGPKVLTGHDNGLITLALSEADDAERERRRSLMKEPYRALMGHFRHEVGHYYWDRLIKEGGLLAECRALFGDDEADYEQALKQHYRQGPPAGWRENFVTAYATTHAWEDWAETWAHYLHIVDSLDTAGAFGLQVHPGLSRDPALHVDLQVNSYGPGDFTRLVQAWLPLTAAMNSMNRSMGLPDLYPFVLTKAVIHKLAFIHGVVHGRAGGDRSNVPDGAVPDAAAETIKDSAYPGVAART